MPTILLIQRAALPVLESTRVGPSTLCHISQVTPLNRRARALPRQAWAACVLACCLHPSIGFAQNEAVPAFKSVDSMEARVQGCVTCHGQSGQGTNNGYFPRIAGKPAGYLYNQLVAFRDGTRQYPPMNYLVAYLPDAYLREMAEYFAKQRPPFAAQGCGTRPTRRCSRAARRSRPRATRSKGIPACIACHGARSDRHGARHSRAGRAARRPTSRAAHALARRRAATRPSPTA